MFAVSMSKVHVLISSIIAVRFVSSSFDALSSWSVIRDPKITAVMLMIVDYGGLHSLKARKRFRETLISSTYISNAGSNPSKRGRPTTLMFEFERVSRLKRCYVPLSRGAFGGALMTKATFQLPSNLRGGLWPFLQDLVNDF